MLGELFAHYYGPADIGTFPNQLLNGGNLAVFRCPQQCRAPVQLNIPSIKLAVQGSVEMAARLSQCIKIPIVFYLKHHTKQQLGGQNKQSDYSHPADGSGKRHGGRGKRDQEKADRNQR